MIFEFDWTLSISFLFSLAAMVFAFFRTRHKNVDERFEKQSHRIDGLEIRLSRNEQILEDMPTKDDLHRLELALSAMAGELKAMAASQRSTNDFLRRIETTVSRHEDHLRGTTA